MKHFHYLRIILCIDLSIWYIKLINVASCFISLGPKLVMIQKMVKEMVFFILIILIFFLAYAVPTTGFFNYY